MQLQKKRLLGESAPGARVPAESGRGMALILVVVVLSALMIIGTPFVVSMRLQERGADQTLAQKRAEIAATSARNHAVAHLMQSHPSREHPLAEIEEEDRANSSRGSSRGSGGSGGSDSDELAADHLWDDWDEIEVPFPATLPIAAVSGATDADIVLAESFEARVWNQRVLDVVVEDEQAKVNLNTASPMLLGNLFGSSFLAEALTVDDDAFDLPLLDTQPFYADQDPDTVDGVVAIYNPFFLTFEAISYRGKTDEALTGCFRGDYFSPRRNHGKYAPVIDLRAMKLFTHRYTGLPGSQLRTYRTPQSMREIADWSVVPYFLRSAEVAGINVRNLDDLGFDPKLMSRAGLAGWVERAEQPVDRKVLREARNTLRDKGVPSDVVNFIEEMRGAEALVEAARMSELVEFDPKVLKEVQDRVEEQLKELKKRTKKELPKALASYAELADVPGLETITARKFEQIRDLVTTTSRVACDWSAEYPVVGNLVSDPLTGFTYAQLPEYDSFGWGALVRVRSNVDPTKVDYRYLAAPPVRGNRTVRNFGSVVSLKGALDHSYQEGEALLSVAQRHPININTASRSVLAAVFTGLFSSRSGESPMNRREGEALADRLIDARPIDGWERFREVVIEATAEDVVDSRHQHAILLNALNPTHNQLFISTTGFCYTTGDVYTVEATGKILSEAGVEMASRRTREVIEIAPPELLHETLTSQADWSFQLFAKRALSRQAWDRQSVAIPGSRGNLMLTGPRALFAEDNFFAAPTDSGYFTALTTEVPTDTRSSGAPQPLPITWDGPGNPEHFAETLEGQDLADGPFVISTRKPASSVGGVAVPAEDLIRRPGMVEFWLKPQNIGSGGEQTIFDSLADPAQPDKNRIRLFYDGASSELVFQINDDTGLQSAYPTGSLPAVAAAEIRHQVSGATFRNDTWYHIAAIWGSTTPGDQALLVDGRPVGKNIWMTKLNGALTIESNTLRVEDNDVAALFPPVGTLLVGTEAIDYSERQGGSFRVRLANTSDFRSGRGARGTVRQAHPKGTPVSLFGYAAEIAPSDPLTRMSLSGDIILVGTGGAELAHPLPISKRNFGGIWSPSAYPIVTSGLGQIPGDADTTIKVAQDPALAGFPQRGYLEMRGFSVQGIVHELIKYSGYRAVDGTTWEFWGCGRNMNGSDGEVRIGSAGLGFVEFYGISIEATGVNLSEAYPPRGVIQIQRGGGARSAENEVEWIIYDRIVEDRYFLASVSFVEHEDRPNAATGPPVLRGFRGFTGDVYLAVGQAGSFRRNPDSITDHTAGQPIVPVVRLIRPLVAPGEFVNVGDTEVTGNTPPLYEPRPLRVHKARVTESGTYVSFFTQPQNNYFVRGNPKIKRFPSGELPNFSSQEIVFGQPATGVGTGIQGILDEVRLSRAGIAHLDVTSFPAPRGQMRRVTLPAIPGTPSNVVRQALATTYSDTDSVDVRQGLDRLIIVAQDRLVVVEAAGTIVGRDFPNNANVPVQEHLSDFGMSKPEGLLQMGDEVLHYADFGNPPLPTQAVSVQLVQDLPMDQFFDASLEVDDSTRVLDPERDLRAEVVREVVVDTTAGLPGNGGFLEFNTYDKEVIYYQSCSGDKLFNVLRGQLGTPVVTHVTWQNPNVNNANPLPILLRLLEQTEVDLRTRSVLGTERQTGCLGLRRVRTLPHLNVTRLNGNITPTSIPVDSTAGFGNEAGYLLYDDGNANTEDEIIAYSRVSGATSFERSRNSRTLEGIFRGRFGTPIIENPSVDHPLIELRTRYHDHYQAQTDSPDLNFIEKQFAQPGAYWDRLFVRVQEQRNRTFKNEVRLLVRFDGSPPWDAEPTNKPGGLYLLSGDDEEHPLGVRADAMEVRILFRYPPGSFGRVSGAQGGVYSDDWKVAPVVDRFSVQYRKPWRVVHREDLSF